MLPWLVALGLQQIDLTIGDPGDPVVEGDPVVGEDQVVGGDLVGAGDPAVVEGDPVGVGGLDRIQFS